jgi:hypothetical protein
MLWQVMPGFVCGRGAIDGPSGPTPVSYWNALGSGDRTASITISTTATLGGGTINNLIDGGFSANSTDGFFFTAQSTREIKFDLGVGVTKIINEFIWIQDVTQSQGTWVFEGSNDDITYTGIGASFTLGGIANDIHTLSNSTAYRYYKLRQTAGTTSGSPWVLEILFKIADPTDVARDALESGDRTALITVSTTATLGGGTINNLVDGAFAANSTDACEFNNAQSTRVVKFDLGVGVTKIITGFIWLQDITHSASQGTWVFEGSNDDITYTGIGASFTLGLPNPVYTFTNSTAYRYYQLRQTAGTTTSTPWLLETQFRVA